MTNSVIMLFGRASTVLGALYHCRRNVRSACYHGVDNLANAAAVREFIFGLQCLLNGLCGVTDGAVKAFINDLVAGIGSGREVVIFKSFIQFSK